MVFGSEENYARYCKAQALAKGGKGGGKGMGGPGGKGGKGGMFGDDDGAEGGGGGGGMAQGGELLRRVCICLFRGVEVSSQVLRALNVRCAAVSR